MPPVTWTPNQAPHPGTATLRIGGDNAYQRKAIKALNELNQTNGGSAMLDGLLRTKNVVIVPWDSTYNFNCCICPGRSARALLAQAWIDDRDKHQFATELKKAREQIGYVRSTLAKYINETPKYRIQGVPSAAGANWGITDDHIRDWEESDEFPKPYEHASHDDQRDLYNAVVVSLRHSLSPGSGSGSKVHWNPASSLLNIPSQNLQLVKPPVVSLGHELVHAYYNAMGMQLNTDDSNSDAGVLYEYMAVGLGPWRTAAISENKFRGQLVGIVYHTPALGRAKRYGTMPLRPAYG